MRRHTLEFVQSVHDLMLAEAPSLKTDGDQYWQHYTSAIDDETCRKFDAFYNLPTITECVVTRSFSQDDQSYINSCIYRHKKIVGKIAAGKKFNSYTGRPLMTDRKISFMTIVSRAIRVCEYL